jgi:hypothetical protein
MKQLAVAGMVLALVLSGCGSSQPVAASSGGSTGPGGGPGSLYSGPAPRPGPDILYEPLADAPQLENTGIWQAAPILVSGASAYRDGEFLYQDFLFDDHGAKELPDPTDPRLGTGLASGSAEDATDSDIFSLPVGTYTYPTGAGYANNAADLVELRIKPTSGATAFRITLNTLENPALVGFTIAIGGASGTSVAWPHQANVKSPAQLFLTVYNTTAELLNADGSPAAGSPPTVSLDPIRRQYTVLLPLDAFDPTGQVVRFAAGVGLWDASSNAYLAPGAIASAAAPGGGGGVLNPPALFNLAFRYNAQEPMPTLMGVTTAANLAEFDIPWWRDEAQGKALASGDISQFFASVDFNKLAAGVDDDMPGQPTGVPQSGPMDRIVASHFETEQGADYSVFCGVSTSCKGELRSRLQPYAIYVPEGSPPEGGWGLQLLLHSLSANYNQFLSSRNQSEFANRGSGYITITPEGRGPDGWYYDYAGADTFEVWADVAARYPLNPASTDIAGYSMGGYGTYKFSCQFPDLFAKAQPTVGPPALGIWIPPAAPTGGEQSNTNLMLASVRNIPFLIWDETTDELVPVVGPVKQAATFGTLGYRYEFDLYTVGEHLTLAINDQYAPAAAFLATDQVNLNPAHVSYVYNPTMDFAADGTASGHAYWLSNVTLRDASGTAPLGTVDVRSEGFGEGDPTASGVGAGAGILEGGYLAPLPFVSETQTWSAVPSTPVADTLDITTSNVSQITINPSRAQVDCKAKLNVSSDGPLQVILTGC